MCAAAPELTACTLSPSPMPSEALFPLLMAQGPVLLQFFQLWGVLAALSPAKKDVDAELEQARTAGGQSE